MNISLLGLILGSVTLSAIAQLVLKLGMSSAPVQEALTRGSGMQLAWLAATNWQVLGGLALYALGAILWLLVLARSDVSFAYPFVALGFIITMVLGWAILGESLGAARLIGTLLIVAGVSLVSSSGVMLH